jgi:hypothetical protein
LSEGERLQKNNRLQRKCGTFATIILRPRLTIEPLLGGKGVKSPLFVCLKSFDRLPKKTPFLIVMALKLLVKSSKFEF